MLRLSGVVARVRGEDYPIGERESEVANCAMRAMPYLDPNRPVSVWTVRLADGRPHGTWKYGVPQWGEVYVATFELACEDCNGAGMVPAIGPEEGEVDGYVPCPKCREGGAA